MGKDHRARIRDGGSAPKPLAESLLWLGLSGLAAALTGACQIVSGLSGYQETGGASASSGSRGTSNSTGGAASSSTGASTGGAPSSTGTGGNGVDAASSSTGTSAATSSTGTGTASSSSGAGGSCTSAGCAAVVIATGLPKGIFLAVPPIDDGSFYYVTGGPGGVVRYTPSSDPSVPQATLTLSSGVSSGSAIACSTDGEDVYWGGGGSYMGMQYSGVFESPVGTMATEGVSYPITTVGALVPCEMDVYLTGRSLSSTWNVSSFLAGSTSGGMTYSSAYGPHAIAGDGASAYWIDTGGDLWSTSTLPAMHIGAVTSPGNAMMTWMAATPENNGNVYWLAYSGTGWSIRFVPKSSILSDHGGAPLGDMAIAGATPTAPAGLIADLKDNLYWLSSDAVQCPTDSGDAVKGSLTMYLPSSAMGSVVTVVPPLVCPSNLVQSDGYVYWTDFDGNGQTEVWRMPKP